MAFSSNPKIPNEGLVLLLDAADLTSARSVRAVEVMVVGGGGGGGMDMGGGGGGGGVLYDSNYKVTPGEGITVTVGAGGFGAPAGSGGYRTDGAGPQPNLHQFTISATNGSDSVFGNLIAKGGGFGASSYYGYTPNQGYGGTGASGGGCSGYTHGGERYVDSNNIVGQGFPGGNSGNPSSGGDDFYSGGGGGAGGRGTSGPNHVAPSGPRGHGGPGVIIPRMSPYYYGGGGGGSGHSNDGGGNGGLGGGGGGADCSGVGIGVGDTNGRNSGGNGGSGCSQPGGNGGANTGGGGGGGSHYNYNNKGGEGGSGIVIVRYNGPQAASGGTYTFVNGVSFHTFTSSGTFTPSSTHTTWHDASGKSNNASLLNGTSHSSLNNGAMVFDGTNDYGNISTFTSKPTAQITCVAWIKPSRGVSTGTVRGSVISNTNSMYLGIFDSADGGSTHGMHWANMTTNSRPYNTNGSIPNNAWSHLVGTYDGATSRAYINGVEIWSSAQTGTIPDGTYVVGTYGPTLTDVTHNFQGLIGTAKIYTRALSAKEILQSYTATKSRFGL